MNKTYFFYLFYIIFLLNTVGCARQNINNKTNLCAQKTIKNKKNKKSKKNRVSKIDKIINNFHTVEPGVFYRSAQLTSKFLEKIIKKLDIKTIINLRGENIEKKWWQKEQKIALDLNVKTYDIPMEASRLPQKDNLIKLLNVYDTAKRPILIHCYGGADRTGEASALWILEQQENNNKKKALKQLSLKYRHFPFAYPAKRFFIKLWQGKKWLLEEYNPQLYVKYN